MAKTIKEVFSFLRIVYNQVLTISWFKGNELINTIFNKRLGKIALHAIQDSHFRFDSARLPFFDVSGELS